MERVQLKLALQLVIEQALDPLSPAGRQAGQPLPVV